MHDFHANQLIPSEPPMQKKHNYIAARHPRAGEREVICGQSGVRAQERSPAL
jgi:hypothetical protein